MMGLIIKGGIDTPSQYIFIEDLVKGSMAETNGRLRRGDQIIMLGEECLVGMDSQQAQDLVTIANKKTKIELVVSRKKAEETAPAAQSKPVAEIKPVAEVKPVAEMKPVAEAKPKEADMKPEKKPAARMAKVSTSDDKPTTLLAAASFPAAAPESQGHLAEASTVTTTVPKTDAKEQSTMSASKKDQPKVPKSPEPTTNVPGVEKDEDEVDGPAAPVVRKLQFNDEVKEIAAQEIHDEPDDTRQTEVESNVAADTRDRPLDSKPSSDDVQETAQILPNSTPSRFEPSSPLLAVAESPSSPSSLSPSVLDQARDPVSGELKTEVTKKPSPRPPRSPRSSKHGDGERLSSASHDTEKIVVTVNKAGGPLGLALAGGSDTDVGDIRVKRVVPNSAAGNSKKIQVGDGVLSVNGKSLENATYADALAILKATPDEVTLILTRRKQATAAPLKSRKGSTMRRMKRADSRTAVGSQATLNDERVDPIGSSETLNKYGSDDDFDRVSLYSTTSERRGTRRKMTSPQSQNMPAMTMTMARRAGVHMKDVKGVEITKGNSGLGFSVGGGKDTDKGNKPLYIKTVFPGSPAERCGQIKEGDLLIEVNGKDFTMISRAEAVSFLKGTPVGTVRLLICSVSRK